MYEYVPVVSNYERVTIYADLKHFGSLLCLL